MQKFKINIKKPNIKWWGYGVIAAAVVAAFLSIVTGHNTFLSLEGLIIVVGGCVANAYLSYDREDVLKAFNAIVDMLNKRTFNGRKILQKDILRLIKWNNTLQLHDLIGLERETMKEEDPFLRYGLDLVVTEYPPGQIRRLMHTVADAEFERECAPVTVLRNMAATAPTFGMVGTLVGMMLLLQNIGTDINILGSGLSMAMLATLYGILLARLICLPAADKLLQKQEHERFRNYMRAEGLAILAQKKSAYYMQDRLNSFLEPSKRLLLEDTSHLIYLHKKYEQAA